MKIIQLTAANIKRLNAISITPDGNLIEIAGRNAQGKSSVLDCITYALAGEREIDWEPVKRGAEKGVVVLDLGDDGELNLKVTRTFRARTAAEKGQKPYTTSLTVEDANGGLKKAPQDLLNAIVGKIAFDPLQFAEMKPPEQVETLRALVPGVDFDAIEAKRRRAFEDRTDANRRARQDRTRASGIIVPPHAPDAPVDVGALTERLAAIGQQEVERERQKARQERERRGLAERENDADQVQLQIEALKEKLVALQAQIAGHEKAIAAFGPLPAVEDATEIRGELNMAQELNAAYARAQQRAELDRQAEQSESEALQLTKLIESLDAEVEQAIANAELPVSGLTFDAEGVYLKGFPFDQASQAERLRASLAIAIAMNPRLRVCIIKQGAFLDGDAMEVLAKVAEAEEVQCWIERVDPSSPAAIIIEDGRAKT